MKQEYVKMGAISAITMLCVAALVVFFRSIQDPPESKENKGNTENSENKTICNRCNLVELSAEDRGSFETPLDMHDRGSLPRCVDTIKDGVVVNSKCCLVSEDPMMACPSGCFSQIRDTDKTDMEFGIARMRTNSRCWTRETVPENGFVEI